MNAEGKSGLLIKESAPVIKVVPRDKRFDLLSAGLFVALVGIVAALHGYIKAVDTEHGVHVLYESAWKTSTIAGSGKIGNKDGPPSIARFCGPSNIAISKSDYSLYVTDMCNDSIRRIYPNGSVI